MIAANGSYEYLLFEAQRRCQDDLSAMLADVVHVEGLMWNYQCAWLYALAQPTNGGHILEIGTYKGKSALVMALACPQSHIVSLTTQIEEVQAAAQALAGRLVDIRIVKSWDYLSSYAGPELDMVFVDGDHRHVRNDFGWFNWLRTGGVILFHDWSMMGTSSVQACYHAINEFSAKQLGRPADVKIRDLLGVGMAGFYRREGERV